MYIHRASALVSLLESLQVVAYTRSFSLDQTWANHQKCVDIGGLSTFQPQTQPSLMVLFRRGGEGVVSVVVFELGDEHLGGIGRPGSNKKEVLCTKENSQYGLCHESELGEFLISDQARRAAKRPLITRAVNVSSPISLHYPITGPGFYCAAAVGFTAKAFSATMLAINTDNCNLPAFRAGELAVYQHLGPAWIVLAMAWALRAFEASAPLCWLVPLSALQVGLRWRSVELGERDGSALKILWYVAEAAQGSGVLAHTHRIATAGHRRDSKSWLIRISLVIFIAAFAATSVADFGATAVSRASAYCNVFLGSFFVAFTTICVIQLLRPKSSTVYDKNTAAVSPGLKTKHLAGLLGMLCLCCATVGFANAWIAMQPLQHLEFGQRFWRMRVWVIQTPYEFIFLIWTACAAVYCRHQHPPKFDDISGVEELQNLSAPADSGECGE